MEATCSGNLQRFAIKGWDKIKKGTKYMKLYRIILVDDEEEVRKSIIRKIKWEENGFLVAGDAENRGRCLRKD